MPVEPSDGAPGTKVAPRPHMRRPHMRQPSSGWRGRPKRTSRSSRLRSAGRPASSRRPASPPLQ